MNILDDLFTGLTFGIAAGISPGPLLALLVSETIKGHKKNGFLVSISPIFTDIPILLICIFLIDSIEKYKSLLKGISFIGGLVLIYYGIKNLKEKEYKLETDLAGSFQKAVLLNILNPYTYLFWFFVGAPYVKNTRLIEGVVFLLAFFIGIVGIMILITLFTEKIKKFIESRYYIYLLKVIGFLFIIFGILLLKDTLYPPS